MSNDTTKKTNGNNDNGEKVLVIGSFTLAMGVIGWLCFKVYQSVWSDGVMTPGENVDLVVMDSLLSVGFYVLFFLGIILFGAIVAISRFLQRIFDKGVDPVDTDPPITNIDPFKYPPTPSK